MNNINDRFNKPNLNPWQRLGLIVLGAIIGGTAVYGLLRWLERRRSRQHSIGAVPPII